MSTSSSGRETAGTLFDRREFITKAVAALAGAPIALGLLQGCHGGALPLGGAGLGALIARLDAVAQQQRQNAAPTRNDGIAVAQEVNRAIAEAWNQLAGMSQQEIMDSASDSLKPALNNFVTNHGLVLNYSTGSPRQFTQAELGNAAMNAPALVAADPDRDEKVLIALFVLLLTGLTGQAALDIVNEIAARDTQRTSEAAWRAITGSAPTSAGTAGSSIIPYSGWTAPLALFILFLLSALGTSLSGSSFQALGMAMAAIGGFHLCLILYTLIFLSALYLAYMTPVP